MVRTQRTFLLFALFILALVHLPLGQVRAQSPCDVVQISPADMPRLYSPDSSMYLVNKQDTAGVYQIYVGHGNDTTLTCISLNYPWSLLRPWSQRNKMQVQWHPSGNFIICAVEKEFYIELLFTPYDLLLGWLESGIWMDIWAVTPDGNNWYQLENTEHGFTGVAFTPDGGQGAWAEAQDSSNLFVDVFGTWDLQLSDFMVNGGVPSFTNTHSIQPAGARWIEPGNFAPDGHRLLISSDIGLTNAQGQDQFILDILDSSVVDLNNSPMVWDEHGFFSPDGHKVLFMSSYPYQDDTNSYHTLSIKTEFMIMNDDGTDLQQLTHLCDTGYVESPGGIAAIGFWNASGSVIYALSLTFPNYESWIIQLEGDCGNADISTDLPDLSSDGAGFNVYPVPATTTLHMDAAHALDHANVTVYDHLGRMQERLMDVNGTAVEIDVSDLPSGVYSVVLREGMTSEVKRVVIAR